MSRESIACLRCGFPRSTLEILELPTSPCPELRHSNTAPEDSAYADIRREIDKGERALALIDEKMDDLQRVLDELAVMRQELQDFVADHQSVVAPIRKLPNELLSEIFLQCAARERIYDNQWNPSTDPEWMLVQVCSLWRAAALSTPRIW
ncbi:hypothetical protein C8R44DRAFT_632527, partial [Mycena epipterygia]